METSQKNPRPVLALVALLALASALGVAVAVALAGFAMLLAAPAYAAEGSLFLARRGALAEEYGHARRLEVYYNPFDEPLAGVYLPRLPLNARLERLTFALGDFETQPAVIVLRPGAAHVEQTAEIGPGETLRVELEYRSRGPRRVLARYSSPS